MRNTQVPLTAAYLSPDGTVLELHDLKPFDETPAYSSSDNIRFVLEVAQAGFSDTGSRPGRSSARPTAAWLVDWRTSARARPVKIALAQVNTTVGDFAGNEAKLREAYTRPRWQARTSWWRRNSPHGYPPRDLLLRRGFVGRISTCCSAWRATPRRQRSCWLRRREPVRPGREVTNTVALLHRGGIVATTKTLLPTYDVFDEDRYFEPATDNAPVEWAGHKLSLTM
jgi:hypothetical protein